MGFESNTAPLSAELMDAPRLEPSEEGRFLLAAIQRGVQGNRYDETSLPPDFGQLDWSEVLRLAFESRTASLLAYTLAPVFPSGRVPEPQRDILKKFFLETTQKNLRIRHSLNVIISRLAERGIEAIVLKGADLAFSIWPHMATRQMHDIDIVVPVDRVNEAMDVLLRLGYQTTRDELSIEWHLKHTKEISALVEPRSGIEVEIHYRFFTPNPRIKIDESPFWKHTNAKDFGGVSAKVLADDELLVLLCLHVSVGHFLQDNIRSLLDIKLLIEARGSELDHAKIDAYLKDPHVGPLLAFPIFICANYLDVDFRPTIDDAHSVLSRHYSGLQLAVLRKSAAHFLLKNDSESLFDRILTRLASVAIYDSSVSLVGLIIGFFEEQKEVIRHRSYEKVSRFTSMKNLIHRRIKFVWSLIRPKS
jgi:hypothetical protein